LLIARFDEGVGNNWNSHAFLVGVKSSYSHLEKV
jgi:hypothetical protein